MLKVACPRCSRLHYADEQHVGRLLRCAGCGDAVQIGASVQSNKPIVSSAKAMPSERLRSTLSHKKWRPKTKRTRLAFALLVFVLIGTALMSWRTRSAAAKDHDAPETQPIPAKSQDTFDRVVNNGEPQPTQNRDYDPQAPWRSDSEPTQKKHHRSLPNGTHLMRDEARRGHGELTIDNYSDIDAVASVLVSSTGQPVRVVFVRHGERYKFTSLTSGDYRVRFAMGTDWDSSTRDFHDSNGYFEFGKVLSYDETEQSDRVQYSVKEITLNTDPKGDVPRLPISREQFMAAISQADSLGSP